MTEITVIKEQAELEFDNWRVNCDIDFDLSDLSDEQKALVSGTKRRFVKAMTAGRLTVDGDTLIYILSDKNEDSFAGKEIKIQNPGAKLRLAMDGFKETQQAEKEIAGMSALTGQDVGFFRRIYTTDFNLLEGILALFMLS